MVKFFSSFLYVLVSFCLITQVQAQQPLNYDSLSIEAENLLTRLHNEKQLDSIIKSKLLAEIGETGNAQKVKQLEKVVAEMHIRDSLRKAEQLERIEALKQHAIGYAIAPFTDTLFYIYLPTGPFTAAQRASLLNKHIVALYEDPFFNKDSLLAVKTGTGIDVVYKSKTTIYSITELDAMWANKPIQELAQENVEVLQHAIVKHKTEYGLYNQLLRIGKALGILVLLILLIKLINKPLRALTYYLTVRAKLETIKITDNYSLNIKQYRKIIFKIISVIKALIFLVCTYLALLFIFNIFPETRGWTNTLISWVLMPLKSAIDNCIAYLPKLFTIVVIFILFKYVIKTLQYVVNEIERGKINLAGFHSEWAKPTFGIIKFLLYVFFFILIFPYLPGAKSAAFQGVSVFIGVLLSLGSSSAISNIIAGLIITYMRPFKIGDRIKIGESIGDVIEKTILVTRIRTIKNEEITVPNAQVLLNNTINYSSYTKPHDSGLILYTTVTLDYHTNQQIAEALLIKAAEATEGILPYPKPFVFQTGFNDVNISYQINAYTKNANIQDDIYSNLHKNIHRIFDEAGIGILSPNYTIYKKDE
jgi:small-conductance mechanosensitive channel